MRIFIVCIITSFVFTSVKERGVVPTVRLLQDQWIGVDLSNYFSIDNQLISYPENSNFQLRVSNDSLWINANSDVKGYHSIPFYIGKDKFILMSQTEPVHYHKFILTKNDILDYLKPDINHVFVMGNFNNWSRTSHPLKFNGFSWELIFPFSPGNYEYKFVINNEEIIDPSNNQSKPNGFGGFNSTLNFTNSLINSPCLSKQSWDTTKKEISFLILSDNDNLKFDLTIDNKLMSSSMFNVIELNHNKYLNINVDSVKDGLVRIYASDDLIQNVCLENHTVIKDKQPLSAKENSNHHHFNIIYSLMVDRFNNGSKVNDIPVDDSEVHYLANYHGGDILGITKKIKEGYFSDLGVNTIWISPIMQGPERSFTESVEPHRKYTGYHGYWPIDSRAVDYRFGTENELKKMIDFAHSKNIKVLLDFVSNHTHEDHPYFIANPEWYGSIELDDGTLNIRKWSQETMLTTWFETFLPSFDYVNNQLAINQVVDDAVYWVEKFNFDGFRQDATKHVPHKFWKQLKSRLDDDFPDNDIFQIGETFGDDELIKSYVNPGELDSQFNFSNYFNFREHLSKDKVDIQSIKQSINQNLLNFGPINFMGNITSSHDQVRFMALVDGQIRIDENGLERSYIDLPQFVKNSNSYKRHFMFTAINMMLPGIPVIYYGEEYGQIGSNDPGNRTDMRFNDDWNDEEQMLFQKVRSLIHARKKYSSFALGDLSFLTDDKNILICKKQYFDDQSLFIFNFSNKKREVTFLPDSDGTWLSILDRSMLKVNNSKTRISIEPNGTKVYNKSD